MGGYAFGGHFYDAPPAGRLAGRVTTDDAAVVAAVRWMATYAGRHDVRRLAAFQQGFVGSANDPFYLGKVGMKVVHSSTLSFTKRYAPGVEFGVAPLPAPPGGEYPSGWLGGWSVTLPRGTAGRPEAFEFCRWMCDTAEGSAAVGRGMHSFPAYRASPFFDDVRRDPQMAVFYDILVHAKHARSEMPVQGYLMLLLRRAMDQVLYGDRDPAAAMAAVAVTAAQARLDEVVREQR